MRLLDCHIENFGKLSNIDYVFGPGINIINEENGWGKSTFATFIRVMFYGFEGEHRQKLSNERKRFAPWQGGTYGGYLRFEVADETYRIERTFGNKEAEDTVDLYYDATGLITDAFDKSSLGEQLWGVDSNSFQRTVFISQDDCRYEGTTEDINKKLGNTAAQNDDDAGYDTIVTRLKKAVSEANSRVSKDSLPSLKKQIAELENEVRQGVVLDQSIEEARKLLREAREKSDSLKSRKKELSEMRSRCILEDEKQIRRKHLLQLEREAEDRLETLEISRQKFGNLIPDRVQVNYASDISRQLETKEASLQAYQLTEDEVYNLDYYKECYGDNPDLINPGDLAGRKEDRPVLFIILLIFSVLFAAFGAAMVAIGQMIVGLAGIILGLTAFIISVITRSITKKQNNISREEEVRRINSDLSEYRMIISKQKNYEKLSGEADDLYLKLKHFTDSLGVNYPENISGFLSGIMEDLNFVEVAKAEYDRCLRNIRQFKEEYPDLIEQEDDTQDHMTLSELGLETDAVDLELSRVESGIRDYLRRLENLNLNRDDISEKEELLEILKGRKDALENRVRLFKLTEESLTKARDAMTKKYTGPISDAFKKYYELLDADADDIYNLDVRSNLTYRACGISRDIETLSRGYKNLIGLCMRLALVDAMYDDEKPFLIMDDPFINLDDNKLGNALDLLRETGRKNQILYFTCNSSRIM